MAKTNQNINTGTNWTYHGNRKKCQKSHYYTAMTEQTEIKIPLWYAARVSSSHRRFTNLGKGGTYNDFSKTAHPQLVHLFMDAPEKETLLNPEDEVQNRHGNTCEISSAVKFCKSLEQNKGRGMISLIPTSV